MRSFQKILVLILIALPCHAPVLIAAEQSNEKQNTILFTNFDKHLDVEKEIRAIPVPIGIYDIGYVVYSKEFAERFGYPSDNIAKLDPGMQALEFRMHTNGGFVECHLNALLDNTLGLDLPEHDYVSRFEQHGDMVRFPQKLDSYKDKEGWYKESPEDKEFRMSVTQEKWHYYSRNTRLASYDYAQGKQGTWAASQMLEGYSSKYIKDLDYISVNIGCVLQTHDQFLLENASLWMKKKGGDDYSVKQGTDPAQFAKFHIPVSFRQKAAEAMETYLKTKYNYFDTVKK